MARKGVVLFARPHPTSRVASIEVTTPSIARFAADRRLRTLVIATTKAARGATTISGTAHGSVIEGSNVKPDGREAAPEAAPDAAEAMFAAARSRLSERSPGQ